MRKSVNTVWYYSAWLVASAVLEVVAVRAANIQRGYKAIGGEWLVFPVLMLAAWFIRDFVAWLKDEYEEE